MASELSAVPASGRETSSAVLAIDASLSGFAYALYSPELSAPRENRIKTEAATSVAGRIARYLKLVSPVVELAEMHKPALCLIEGYSFGSAGGKVSGRAHDRAELGGVLRLLLLPHCGHIAEVAPTTLKKFATGKGVGDKSAVVSALAKRYGRTFSSDDQADAFGLMMLGACMLGITQPDNQAQREAVAKVREQLGEVKP